MTASVRLVVVGVAPLSTPVEAESAAVGAALAAAGITLDSRVLVEADEAALERALLSEGLTVVVAGAGGSAGDIVRRVVARVAGVRLVCAITDGIPAQDMMMVKRYLRSFPRERKTTLVGPNCAGIISPGKAQLGIMPPHIYSRGPVGIVTRSGTLNAPMGVLSFGVTARSGYAPLRTKKRRHPP